jgi:ribosomal protein S18 acetylase RimI-like enzyme
MNKHTDYDATARDRSDFEAEAFYQDIDVVVDPEYQRLGIGSRVMSELLARLPVWRGLLVADRKVQPFYRRLGFESYDDVMAAAINQASLIPRRGCYATS